MHCCGRNAEADKARGKDSAWESKAGILQAARMGAWTKAEVLGRIWEV